MKLFHCAACTFVLFVPFASYAQHMTFPPGSTRTEQMQACESTEAFFNRVGEARDRGIPMSQFVAENDNAQHKMPDSIFQMVKLIYSHNEAVAPVAAEYKRRCYADIQ